MGVIAPNLCPSCPAAEAAHAGGSASVDRWWEVWTIPSTSPHLCELHSKALSLHHQPSSATRLPLTGLRILRSLVLNEA